MTGRDIIEHCIEIGPCDRSNKICKLCWRFGLSFGFANIEDQSVLVDEQLMARGYEPFDDGDRNNAIQCEARSDVMNVWDEIKVFKEIFPKRLEMILKANNMTQKNLADKIGITEASMSRYANAERIPKAPTLVAMAKALGCSVDYLICSDEESYGK